MYKIDNYIYIDRDPIIFQIMIDFLENDFIISKSNAIYCVENSKLFEELEYWTILTEYQKKLFKIFSEAPYYYIFNFTK